MNTKISNTLPDGILSSRVKRVLKIAASPPTEQAPLDSTLVLEFDFQIDSTLVEKALNTLVARHDILRTRFVLSGEQVHVNVSPKSAIALQQFELSDSQLIEKIIQTEQNKRFDLASEPLIAASLVVCDSACGQVRTVLILRVHSAIAEPECKAIILNEFCSIYEDYDRGLVSALAPVKRQYLACLLESAGKTFIAQSGAGDVYRRTDLAQSEDSKDSHTVFKQYNIGANQVRKLKEFAQSKGVTSFAVLKCAFGVMLLKAGLADWHVGHVVSTRRDNLSNDMLGAFDTVIGSRHIVDENTRVDIILEAVWDSLLESLDEVDGLERRDLSTRLECTIPAFDVVLSYEKWLGDGLPLARIGGTLRKCHSLPVIIPVPLSINVVESSHGISLDCHFSAEQFERSNIQSMLTSFELILSAICDDSAYTVKELPFIDRAEFQHLVYGINSSWVDYSKSQCIHELFEHQANTRPDAVALICNGESMSYEELNNKANQLAHYLIRDQGVQPNSLVGVCMSRSFEMVISLLGIMKAGAAYVPLDPTYPENRLSYMIEDTQLAVVLADKAGGHSLPASYLGTVVKLDDFATTSNHFLVDFDTYNLDKRTLGLNSEHLAYVIYTSGSTGKPKGVMIEHQSVSNFISSMCDKLSVSCQDKVLAQTSINFDIHVLELYVTLSAGATLIVASDEQRKTPETIIQLVTNHHITLIQATPSLWKSMFDYGWQSSARMSLLCGGEALSPTLLETFHNKCPQSQVFNMYGPTETTVWSAIATLDTSYCHLGKVIQNTQFYVLDEAQRLQPHGTIGELYIGGQGLARGYLHRPSLTAERFIDNPYYDHNIKGSSKKLYKTGDLVRYLADDNLEFVGRIDDQVKIRGFRIELAEIESVLHRLTAVHSAQVVTANIAGSQQLVGYIKQHNKESNNGASIDTIKAALSAQLPEYMVPSLLIFIEEWPLTPNGKIDKQALPDPQGSNLHGEYVAPSTEIEEKLVQIWAELLDLDNEKISCAASFFNLGGHSLLVNQLLQNIDSHLGVELQLAELFSAVTIHQQAELVALSISQLALDEALAAADEVEIMAF
ncbi:non-ribosomal peptide synthetase [Pseudoalteromonas luteoviolacea]|uniref:non-ribosomal peptide synthetase n=1 Tax=Pseudoalteromonas luteoviolacea TaxID=43657 RepID=UPI001B358E17|nr:non-ribosomal peptide synthetase [Pseudoalteromonas luteoviolacea]MBQ4835990.1 amino acid adenylation domain-containing protein [Pseudoalteromonas luteoviolacea]